MKYCSLVIPFQIFDDKDFTFFIFFYLFVNNDVKHVDKIVDVC